ncbi:MAG: alpha/beta hydrolase [Proteobacteria bacterium]|nr:alpha/beta hydrolase [Pseudomonadota bacterium]
MRTLLTFSLTAILAYLAVCTLLFAFQEKLLFFPRPNNASVASVLKPWRVEIVHKSVTLQGWIVSPAMPGARPLIYYFGGNAEDVSQVALTAAQRADINLVVMNFRGYGGSQGVPSERLLFEDALLVFDQTHASIPNNGRVVAMGRSLGTGVAVHLAAQRPIDALVLVTPYDSIVDVAQGHYPLLPVAPLLKHRFASIERIADVAIPALFLVAERDSVVPRKHALALADAWQGQVTWKELAGTTHNTVHSATDYWPLIMGFLK